ncbi:MAG: hypothetical protein IKU43_10410 [Clostridia bacterium]|nr:hypothetical protein [Clostridia bacterium]
MYKYKEIGKIQPKASSEIKNSKIGLGFEKLDRDAFDPEKVYDRVAESGAKWARIQTGWQKTEKEKGVYDFSWFETIVDNFLSRGIQPWASFGYGNQLYNELAKTVYGAAGVPPISNEEEKAAWISYVKAFVEKFGDRITYFEIWNEPDGLGFWKTGVNPTELGQFTKETAIAIKEVKPDAKVIGGVVCTRRLAYLNTALKIMAPYIDFVSFHEYTHDERGVDETVDSFRTLARVYNPNIEIIQGESGTQSRGGGHGALFTGAWTEEIQAKQLARHTFADLMAEVHFTSYFTCVDMVEAINGTVGDLASYTDYGYFGILGAQFEGGVKPTGEYYKKPSFYVFQNINSLFAEDVKVSKIPIIVPHRTDISNRTYEPQLKRCEFKSGCFEREGGKAFVYWNPTNIMTTSFRSEVTIEIYSEYGNNFKLVDVMTGDIYEIPEDMIEDRGDNVYFIHNLTIKDTPLVLTLGNFII